MFLSKIKLLTPIDKLVQLEIEITKPILCLVGDNGIGKTTIMDAIREDLKIPDQSYFKRDNLSRNFELTWNSSPSKPKAYDTHAEDKKYAGAFGNDIEAQVASMRMSSGEANILFLSRIFATKPDFLIVDEIERGLSIKNQLIVGLGIQSKISTGTLKQIIVSCHSSSIIEIWEMTPDQFQLFDIESNKNVTWDEYRSSQNKKALQFFIGKNL